MHPTMVTTRTARGSLLRLFIVLVAACVLIGVASCGKRVPPKVFVDVAVDKEIALPIFAEYAKTSGVRVRVKYGSDKGIEAGGTESMVAQIVAEREAPRCDLFWNHEILHTLALDRAGLLRPFSPSSANALPPSARSPHDTWYAIASEARVLVINMHQIAEARRPDSIYDLTDPQWYERTGIAKPLTGLSATHAACLFQTWGDVKAREFFVAVKRNARILLSDREVAQAVASGSLAFGLTSSSDAVEAIESDAPVTIIYPDQAEYALGTLYIPMTVALVKDSPHPEPAEQLLDRLLSADVAMRLAEGPAALIPLRTGATASKRIKTPEEVRTMRADFAAAADEWDATVKILGELFAAP
jgi:iron(III) transport system substrate-binding protein